jgi:hypothetical protein
MGGRGINKATISNTRKEEGRKWKLAQRQSATMAILKVEITRQPSIIGQAKRARFSPDYIKKKHMPF